MPTSQMLHDGMVLDGEVNHLADFGAFVDITTPDGTVLTGLVHVTEIGDRVENPYAELEDGEPVTVKVLRIRDDGKIDLSIRQADPEWDAADAPPQRPSDLQDVNRQVRKFMHQSQVLQGELRKQRQRRRDPATYSRQRRRKQRR